MEKKHVKEYMEKRRKSSLYSSVAGVIVAGAIHLTALLCLSFNGLTYIWPPPAESSFIIDFTEEIEVVQPRYGKEPVAEKVDKEKPVELVKRSESPVKDEIPNETPAQTPDNFGDVEVPDPQPDTTKPKFDPRAAFPGMSRSESSAGTPHVASESSPRFAAGQSDGNSRDASEDGKSNAHLEGRKVVGSLETPNYPGQESGIVIVTIWVDIYGIVQNAVAGAPGTTVDDKDLWNEARKAAMSTHFTKVYKITADTPQLQEGTITYIFKLK